jgi:hypothetical protein
MMLASTLALSGGRPSAVAGRFQGAAAGLWPSRAGSFGLLPATIVPRLCVEGKRCHPVVMSAGTLKSGYAGSKSPPRSASMKIIPCGSVATVVPPEAYFTGRVLQQPVIEADAPARVRAALVSFEPGARTAWHTHPLGQTLQVVSGAGLAQTWGGPIREI